ncbi:hypothetical protein [Desulfofundulus sp.]|uniref:hypothetical protein n=1 Tax=Desulfofundulus sp. TaxID=2282750 RepID=UPI003C76C214
MAETMKKRTRKIILAETYVLSGYDLTAACRAAGYKNRAWAYQLLQDPEVREHIAWVEEMRREQTINLRKAIDAGAVDAYRDLLAQKKRLVEFLERNPGTAWAERLLKDIAVYLIDKSIPDPPQKHEHSGPDGEALQIIIKAPDEV